MKGKEKIPGISGFPHCHWLAYRLGLCSKGQLVDGANSTPWVERKLSYLNAFKDETFKMTHEKLDPIYKDVLVLSQEYADLMIPILEPPSVEGEEGLRMESEYRKRCSEAESRKAEVLSALAKSREELESADSKLWYTIDQAAFLLRALVSSYWEGLLAASKNRNLPPFPDIELFTKTLGQKVYEARRNAVTDILDRVLNDKEVTADELV